MGKRTKTAAELEAMILRRMQTLSECPDGMTVTVKRRGATWEAVTMSLNQITYPDCVTRVARHAAVLRTEYALGRLEVVAARSAAPKPSGAWSTLAWRRRRKRGGSD